MRNVAIAIALLGVLASGLVVGCSSSGSSTITVLPATTSAGLTFSAAPTPTGNAEPPVFSDADEHGFFVFGNGARCLGTDNAEMFMRTEKSALVVCRSEVNRLYYRGYRISDGASIDLYDVSRNSGGFVAVNAPDNARYVITTEGFQLIQNGAVVVSESAIEIGPAPDVLPPATPAGSPVVFGSGSGRGPAALGYGSERPAVISMGNCASAISKIDWQDWGSPVAHGSGVGCVQMGEPPQYSLVVSNIGMCEGVLAYRTLQLNGGSPYDIC